MKRRIMGWVMGFVCAGTLRESKDAPDLLLRWRLERVFGGEECGFYRFGGFEMKNFSMHCGYRYTSSGVGWALNCPRPLRRFFESHGATPPTMWVHP